MILITMMMIVMIMMLILMMFMMPKPYDDDDTDGDNDHKNDNYTAADTAPGASDLCSFLIFISSRQHVENCFFMKRHFP